MCVCVKHTELQRFRRYSRLGIGTHEGRRTSMRRLYPKYGKALLQQQPLVRINLGHRRVNVHSDGGLL